MERGNTQERISDSELEALESAQNRIDLARRAVSGCAALLGALAEQARTEDTDPDAVEVVSERLLAARFAAERVLRDLEGTPGNSPDARSGLETAVKITAAASEILGADGAASLSGGALGWIAGQLGRASEALARACSAVESAVGD